MASDGAWYQRKCKLEEEYARQHRLNGSRRRANGDSEHDRNRKSDNINLPPEYGTSPILGLPKGYTRADVIRAFRQQAHKHHPDKGGDPAIFRRLVEAKDRALALAEVEERRQA